MEKLHILKELAKNLTLLYVEDSDKMREQASTLFRKFFENTLTAQDGGEGVEMFEKHKPDIVVTDISMPILNGLEMARKIKAINPDVKIIITSAYDDKEKLMQAIEIGVFKYLKKPITIQVLTDALIECVTSIQVEDKQEGFEEYVQKIFHSQNSLLLFFKKGELKIANHLFLEFFKVKDIAEFTQKYASLGSLMEQKEGYLCDDAKGAWFDKITAEMTKFFNALLSVSDQKHHFLVSANAVPDTHDEIIVSLSDITGLSLASFDIQESSEPKYPQHDLKSIMQILKVIKENNEEIKLLSFYKGLNIVNPATIHEIYDKSIVVKTEATQVKAASLQRNVVLRSPLFSKDLNCKVINSLEEEHLLVLDTFEQIERSPSQRKFPRLSPASGTHATLTLHQREFSGEVLDISINSIKLSMPALPPTKSAAEFALTTNLTASEQSFEIKGSAKPLKFEEKEDAYDVVFLLSPTKEEEQKIVEYISRRQLELIREFKKLRGA